MVITILSGLAVSAMRQSPTSSHINIRYDLSVALPMQLITQEIAAENAKRYMGNHKVIFHYPNGRDVQLMFQLSFVNACLRGASGTWALYTMKKEMFVKHKIECEPNQVSEIDFVDKTLLF